MSLKPLLNKQTIIIDDHNRGNRESKEWDDKSKDVHIDKRTKYKIDGKVQDVTIRIPINSDREFTVEVNGKRNAKIPSKLYKEIQNTLKNNPELAEAFAKDIVREINNYKSVLTDEKKAQEALNRLSRHFDLEWSEDKIATYVNGKLIAYTQIYRDESQKAYYFTINLQVILLSDITGWSRHEVWLKRFR